MHIMAFEIEAFSQVWRNQILFLQNSTIERLPNNGV